MSGSSEGTSKYEEGLPGTEVGRKEDNPLLSYRDKEPMTPSKITVPSSSSSPDRAL
jgi:hypothetical protein